MRALLMKKRNTDSSQSKTIPPKISLTSTESTVNDDVFQAIQYLKPLHLQEEKIASKMEQSILTNTKSALI